MLVDFRLPHLGDGISSADVVKVLVKEGDQLKTDQVVVEIETDKATVEVPSDVAGTVKKVLVKEGQKANVGEPLIEVEVGGQQTVASSSQSAAGSEKEISKPEPVKQQVTTPVSAEPKITGIAKTPSRMFEFKIPTLGENIASASVAKVLVKNGDKVNADQIVLEIETDKAI